ncbi:MAG: hypothetical protein AAGA54_12600 [Myxococcota bacterium]
MQGAAHGGERTAVLDAASAMIRIFDPAGVQTSQIEADGMNGPAGIHWLAGDEGVVWWDLDRVFVSPAGSTSDPQLAYRVEQPGVDGLPLSIEDVRVMRGGLLVIAQACGNGRVRRRTTLVHVEGAQVVGETDLTPWAGSMLRGATALPDRRVVLAVNDEEHLQAAHLRCMLDELSEPSAEQRHAEKMCWYLLKRSRFHASAFRVLRVHRPGVVEIQSEHACPNESCYVRGWAVGRDTFVVDAGGRLLGLTSALDPGPFFASAGGVWAQWNADVEVHRAATLNSLWLSGHRLLQASAAGVAVREMEHRRAEHWTPEASVRSARFTPEGDAAVVALEDQVVRLDLATMRPEVLIERLEVPASFDARYQRVVFNDASMLLGGALLFDVVALHRIPGRVRAQKLLWVGSYREGCTDPQPLPAIRWLGGGIPTVDAYRRLSPWMPRDR